MAAPLIEDDSPDIELPAISGEVPKTEVVEGTPQPRRVRLVYMQCYFVTIATILGTGILGLPVTLSHSGLYPFLISFVLGFVVQALLIVFFTDLLQRTHAVQLQNAKAGGSEHVPLNELEEDESEEDHTPGGGVMAGHIIIPKNLTVRPPNLHMLGEMFLSCGMRQMFDVILFIQFIAFLISYALAGSEAYAQVLGVDYVYIIPVFVWILTFAVVFALHIIQPVVSILTFAKGSLLLATVIVTFFVGASVHRDISDDFSYMGAPFLMGTVALGGIVNVMPFLYHKIEPVPAQVRGFRTAVILGLTTCTILNILWCWAVLDIVPQVNNDSCFVYQVKHNNSMHTVAEGAGFQHEAVCAHNLSLESAALNGEISTIPLTKIIHELYPKFDWVALLVELFIMISITVSYLTIGAAMHHTISGFVESIWDKERATRYVTTISSKVNRFSTECVCRSLISLIAFSIVFGISMLNPKGFETMLEKAASLFLNLEAGIFVGLMIHKASSGETGQLKIPSPLWSWFYWVQYIIPLYFGFAIVYDVYKSLYDFVSDQLPPLSHEKVHHGAVLPADSSVNVSHLFKSVPDSGL